MRSFIVKENHIVLAVSEIFRCTQTFRHHTIFIWEVKDNNYFLSLRLNLIGIYNNIYYYRKFTRNQGNHHISIQKYIYCDFLGSYGRTGLSDPMDTYVPTWVASLDHPR